MKIFIIFPIGQEEEVDRFYNLYIRTLKNGYENISKHLEMFLQRISAQKGSKKTQLQAFITVKSP